MYRACLPGAFYFIKFSLDCRLARSLPGMVSVGSVAYGSTSGSGMLVSNGGKVAGIVVGIVGVTLGSVAGALLEQPQAARLAQSNAAKAKA